MRARDLMSLPTITVGPHTPVLEVAKLLLESGVSAVPVVGADGQVLGVVSEADLMHRPELRTEKARRSWLSALFGEGQMPRDYVKTRGVQARDVMNPELYTAGPDADLMDIVEIMDRMEVRRVLIMEEDRLVGIVTRSDILKGLLAGREEAARGDSDRAIRSLLLDELRRQSWLTLSPRNVEVADGIIRFSGEVSSEDEQDALRVAAENIPGVVRVEDRTTVSRFMPAED
jgi:CBS domain-containing protein